MDTKTQFDDLNKETLTRLEAYLEAKKDKNIDHHKIHTAKDKWQIAWNEFLETLLALEKLEI
ncbi:MAG: hypothetical protein ABIN36_16695 [Ferruginibacter sp.]